MSVKPYVEYGLGVQKQWRDRFTGYAQAMLRNGGRNGIALTAGFRWALGQETKPIEKVEGVNEKLSSSNQHNTPTSVAASRSTTAQEHRLNLLSRQDVVKKANGGTYVGGAKKIVKQLTPNQKTALGARPQNTTRTTNRAVLKQL